MARATLQPRPSPRVVTLRGRPVPGRLPLGRPPRCRCSGVSGCPVCAVKAAGGVRDPVVALGSGGRGRSCGGRGGGGGGGGPMVGRVPVSGVSEEAEAPALEPAGADSAPADCLASNPCWIREALLASDALLSSWPRRSASCTAVGGRGCAGVGAA